MGRRFVGIAALGLTDAGLLWWASVAGPAQQLTAVLAAATAGCAALLWIAADKTFDRVPLRWIAALAIGLRVLAAQGTPLLEDDHYRYLWDGFRTVTALDPFRRPPSAFFSDSNLTAPWPEVLGGINNPDIPTIYGPTLQWLFALAHVIAPGKVGAIQALLLVADLCCFGLLVQRRVGARWLLAYAVHPLILKEAIASAHPDGLVALFLLLALLATRRHRPLWIGLTLGLAVATKVAALVVVPLFLLAPPPFLWRRALTISAAIIASVSLMYLPFIVAGGSDATALRLFASEWRFNPLLFRAIEIAADIASTPDLARPVAGILVIVGVVAIGWRWMYRADVAIPGAPPIHQGLLLLLLFAPVVNPWYWLWALGPSISAGRCAIAALAGVSVLSYLNSTVLREADWSVAPSAPSSFSVHWTIALAQLLVVGFAWAVQTRAARRRAPRRCA